MSAGRAQWLRIHRRCGLKSPTLANSPWVEGFFDPATATISYLIADADKKRCAIVDPVLDFDPGAARVSTASADRLTERIQRQGWTCDWILETHAHADHLSAAQYLKAELGAPVVIGEHIRTVQDTFADLFNLDDNFDRDGREFDRLVADKDELVLGDLCIRVMHTPGHTPACVTYIVGDAAFVGDTLFMADYGTARADFPGGNASQLYRSIRRILALPSSTRIFHCHDYPPNGREPAWESTVGHQRQHNAHVRDGVNEDEFVQMRTARDSGLAAPALIWPSLQVNIRAGALPPAENNGKSYLKLPLSALKATG